MKLLGFRESHEPPVAPSFPTSRNMFVITFTSPTSFSKLCLLNTPRWHFTTYTYDHLIFPCFKIIKSHGLKKNENFIPPPPTKAMSKLQNPCHLMWLYTPRYLRSTQVAGPSPPTMTWNPSFFRKPGHPLKITRPRWSKPWPFLDRMVFCDPKSWPEPSTFGRTFQKGHGGGWITCPRILTFC